MQVMTRTWVELKENVVLNGTQRIDGNVVPVAIGTAYKGEVGFVTEKLEGGDQITVRFPSCCWTFTESQLKDLTGKPIEFDDAITTIEKYEGHHAQNSEFQFNIKFYQTNVSPLAKIHLSEDEQQVAINQILEDEVRYAFDKEFSDLCISADLGWVDEYWTAGRMGGWLVLDNIHREHSNHFLEEMEKAVSALHDHHEIVDRDEDWEGQLEDLQAAVNEVVIDASDLARDLELIEAFIEDSKERLAEYMKTEDCWQSYYEHKVEEEKEKSRELERIEEFREGWSTLIDVSNILDDEMPELAKDLNKAIDHMYSYVLNHKLHQ